MRTWAHGKLPVCLEPGCGPSLAPTLPLSVRSSLGAGGAVMGACLLPRYHADALGGLSGGAMSLLGPRD